MKIYKNYSKYRNFSLLPCTIMKQKHNIWTVIIVLLFIWIIVLFLYPFEEVNAPVNSPADDTAITYNEESRKTMISSDCTFFFDWCNDCARQENWEIVCHELYCETYKKPRCTDNEIVQYNADSRKEIIAEDCQSFFDGCNNCNKTKNWEIICTLMYCETYAEPVCTDTEGIDNEQVQANWIWRIWIEQPDIRDQEPKKISREEAKNLILAWKIKSIFQTHSLIVGLTTDEGWFTTIEPIIDEVFEIVEQCWDVCKDIRLATE